VGGKDIIGVAQELVEFEDEAECYKGGVLM
jgi:hypothetical protein